jgi:hypothetical protein
MGKLGHWLDQLFEALCSLKLAVVVILLLAGSLATGTVLESLYDTPTAQYYVYRSLWFHAVLAGLGVNIFCVAVSRWPWKPKHIPFLLAHLGILMLLGGSWVTEKFGIDGNIRVGEGETASVVEMDNNSLVLTDNDQIRKVPVPWIPPGVPFRPISLKALGLPYDVTIDQFLSHADPAFSFIPSAGAASQPDHPGLAAAKLKLQGGPMNITQEFWLWMGDSSFRAIQMGPASFAIGPDAPAPQAGRPSLVLTPEKDGALAFRAQSSEGKVVQGRFAAGKAGNQPISPGWKGNVQLTVLEYVPNAVPLTNYHPARVQYGQQAPSSAIHVISGKGGEGAASWLGLGDRAVLHMPNGNVELGYLPQRVVLPFGVRLDRFQVDRYEGSLDPSSYSSRVTVFQDARRIDQGSATTISMNEPLTVKGITLYQSSYEDAQPRPTISIFSVNRDPGRRWKYLGSLLLVSGSVLLFAVKYRKAKVAKKIPAATPQEVS